MDKADKEKQRILDLLFGLGDDDDVEPTNYEIL